MLWKMNAMGNWNSRKMEMGAGKEMGAENGKGTCKNSSYSSDSLPVKFIELCKLSYRYSIVFLLHNKHWPAHNSVSTDAIGDLLSLYNSFSLFNTHCTSMLIHRHFTIWLNLLKFPALK